MTQNAIWNASNPNQGDAKKILCLCSAGLLRSPTLANVLNQRGYNVRAAGVTSEYALCPVNTQLLVWADLVVCVEPEIERRLSHDFGDIIDQFGVPVLVVNIPDQYAYMDPRLINYCEDTADTVDTLIKEKDTDE